MQSLGKWGVLNEEVKRTLTELSRAPNPEVAGTALAARVMLHDKSAMKDFLAFLRAGQATSTPVVTVIFAMQDWKGKEHIETLEGLLEAPDAALRSEAAIALARVDDPGSMSILVRALGDPDIRVRFDAANGLARRSGQSEWAPGFDKFAEDPDYYTDRWRQWWEANKDRYLKDKAVEPERP